MQQPIYICMSWWNMNAAACEEPKEAQHTFHMLAFESIRCGIRKTLRNQVLDNTRIKPFFRDVNSSKSWIPILYNIQRNMMQQSQSAVRATVSLSAASWLQWATSQKQECIPRIEKKKRELVIDSAVRPSGLYDLVQWAINSPSNVQQTKNILSIFHQAGALSLLI